MWSRLPGGATPFRRHLWPRGQPTLGSSLLPNSSRHRSSCTGSRAVRVRWLSCAFLVPDGVTDREVAIWEDRVRRSVEQDTTLPATEREAVIQARRGQGLFRQRVAAIETACRVAGVSNPELLRASHCKPWRDSSNQERLDGENGLLLTPSIDHLFDRGFIGFDPTGELVISPVADRSPLARMGVTTDRPMNAGAFSEGQRRYLEWHLEMVLLKSRRRTGPPELEVE
jgi:hypothetical protein